MKSTEQQIQICREEWFKDHLAAYIPVGILTTIIEWQKPNSWNYGCRFILHSQWLTVLGDIGEAVYQWSENITPKFLAGLDFGYFHSKCRASEVGSRFQCWDSSLAFTETSRILKESDEFFQMITPHTDQQEFMSLLHAAYNSGKIDSDTAAELSGTGIIPHPRCIGHFVGIQMAITQLGLSA